jgi:hypothetical protein
VTAIRRSFPDFNASDFGRWMAGSFFPDHLSNAIACRPSALGEIADAGVVKEKELQIATIVESGGFVHSRLLSVYDTEIMDFEFKGTLPVITVKCIADHTDDIRGRSGEQIIGGPECIRATEFLAAMAVVVTGQAPTWKAVELHSGSTYKRI